MAYPLIDPESTPDYIHNWESFLGEGDSIVSRQWSVSPLNGTSPETPTLTNNTNAAVTIAGCMPGKIYKLTEHIVTSSGLGFDRTIVIRCEHQ